MKVDRKRRGRVRSIDQSFGNARVSKRRDRHRTCCEQWAVPKAFVCPGSTAQAFQFSLKVLAVDVCYVRNKNGGVIHTATCLDGNGNVFPVAFGVSESESEETWIWFFQLLEVALKEDNWHDFVFLSDREKGIESPLSKVLPDAKHGHCVFHIERM